MADRIAEPDDAAVDELKRKARRRLIGAIVLALAAAIVVPMLLERDPRPLGDDVSVQIPPVDDGKFINRLNEQKGDAPAKIVPKPEVSLPPAPPREAAAASTKQVGGNAQQKAITQAEQRVLAPPAQSAGAPVPAAEKAAPTVETKTAPMQPPAPSKAAAAPKSESPKPDPVAASGVSNPSTASAAKAESFVVQLAAFADDKGANALAGKLKRAGYPAYTEPVQTSRGTLWRVRVGAYPSRDAASEARTKLKSDGYSGIVASAQ